MANVDLVDTELANLNIIDEEEDPMLVLGENKADEKLHDLCLVGRVLTDSIVNFPFLRNTLADLWHPLRGVHNLPIGVTSEGTARQLGDFVGKFM
ncbi:hypothetical protein Golob_027969, partial [Gossypium lobatum]|nr:hypothetical protein [Gossypium lobatum]